MLNDNLKIPISAEEEINEKIRISYLKNRGDINEVCKETKCPKSYVLKIVLKFRKEDKRTVTNLVADRVMEHLLTGYSMRTQYLFETLKKAESEENLERSSCCQARIRLMDSAAQDMPGIEVYECLKCRKMTDKIIVTNGDALSLKVTVLNNLAKEDELLEKFARNLGYVGDKLSLPSEAPSIIYEDNRRTINISPEEVAEIQKLGPLEQEALRLKIEKKIAEADITDDQNE